MDYRDYLEFQEHPIMDLHPEIKEGMTLSFNKKLNRFFINNITDSPKDSWGIEWEQIQSCIMLHPEELDILISKLEKMRHEFNLLP